MESGEQAGYAPPQWRPIRLATTGRRGTVELAATFGDFMRRVIWGRLPAICLSIGLLTASLVGTTGAMAQSGDARAQDQSKSAAPTNPGDAAKDNQRKIDEFTEAAQAINGPAGNPECVWLGKRAVILILRDDLDTAFRHLDLYDRFGCPGGHIQAAIRCVTRFGIPDAKATDTMNSRAHACWINPAAQPPQPAAATASAPAGNGGSGGDTAAAPAPIQGQAPPPAKQ